MPTMMLINGFSDPIVLASPVTSFALALLADFCTIDKIYEQSIIALVVVMMLPARAYRQTVDTQMWPTDQYWVDGLCSLQAQLQHVVVIFG
jgi:hypothetical protein